MRKISLFLLACFVSLFLCACQATPEATQTMEPTQIETTEPTPTPTSTPSPTPSPTPEATVATTVPEEIDYDAVNKSIMENAVEIDYDDIFRYPDDYINKEVVFTGTIIVIVPYENDPDVFSLGIYEDDDINKLWYVQYSTVAGGPQLRQGDVVKVYGLIFGTNTTLENNITVTSNQAYSWMVEIQ